MAALDNLKDFVRDKIEKDCWTYRQLSDYLVQAYPGERGFSVRSLERFCATNNIHKTARISDRTLNQVVTDAIAKVGSITEVKTKRNKLYCRLVLLTVERPWQDYWLPKVSVSVNLELAHHSELLILLTNILAGQLQQDKWTPFLIVPTTLGTSCTSTRMRSWLCLEWHTSVQLMDIVGK